MCQEIPQVDFAIIGGSGTCGSNFPEDLNFPGLKILKNNLVFDTPYGESPRFKLFIFEDKKVLHVKLHGWRKGIKRGQASLRLFWVLKEAGVKKIIAEGGVGSINHLLNPYDLIISSDYLDFSLRKDIELSSDYLLAMRQAVCPQIRSNLIKAARLCNADGTGRVFDRGIYAVTDGRHFESPAEIAMLGRLGADIVGQSMCPEAYLAREIAACYARIDIVANYAEGVVEDWQHDTLSRIFYQEAPRMGKILLYALRNIKLDPECNCPQLRYPTLLGE
jgi:5'-methylthioadenosine phosphorylase